MGDLSLPNGDGGGVDEEGNRWKRGGDRRRVDRENWLVYKGNEKRLSK